jgi:acylphosphatase
MRTIWEKRQIVMGREPSDQASLELVISGGVQGVGFRFFVERTARSYNVTGYVINLPDGRVKVIAEGSQQVLSNFLEELKKGPPLAWIESVQVNWGKYQRRFRDFSVRFHE